MKSVIHFCANHPNAKTFSFCSICKENYCLDCLVEGKEYYFCRKENCYSKYLEEVKAFRESYITNPRFCQSCIDETTNETAGNLDTINFVGTILARQGNECPICHSIVANKQYIIFGFPTKSYGLYRLIYLKSYNLLVSQESTFISRKLKN